MKIKKVARVATFFTLSNSPPSVVCTEQVCAEFRANEAQTWCPDRIANLTSPRGLLSAEVRTQWVVHANTYAFANATISTRFAPAFFKAHSHARAVAPVV